VDNIRIEGLLCMAHVGVPESERNRRQKLLLDLDLRADLQGAGRYDRVSETIDYAAVCAEVKKLAEGKPFHLVEAVAESAAERILERFDAVEVRVRVRKFSVPGTESVGVEIVRARKRGT